MIKLQIDVTQIDKEKLFTGKKGTYLNAVLIETPTSQYNDYVIIQETTKEEREQGIKGAILGNAEMLKPKDNPLVKPDDNDQTEQTTDDDDLPF